MLAHPVAQLFSDCFGFLSCRSGTLENHKRGNRLACHFVGPPDHSSLSYQRMRYQRRLDFHSAHSVARHVQHIVDTPGNSEVAIVNIANRAVARQIGGATHFWWKVSFFEPLGVTPNRADH